MAAPTPQAGPNGPGGVRRPRAWLARRMAAVLSVAAMLGLGGLMYWNDQQGTAGATPAAAPASAGRSTTPSANRSDRERGEGDDGEHESEREGDDESGGIVDDITSLIPGLSGSSSSSGSTSNGGSRQSVPAPHTNTRGS